MCDYSLMALSNRLAVPGEELVVHKFQTGAIGLAPYAEVCAANAQRENVHGIVRKVAAFLKGADPETFPAVCVPPGAHLLVCDIPVGLMKEIGSASPTEEVVFTQTSIEYSFRDAVQFSNGKVIPLRKLKPGQKVRVLSTDTTSDTEDVSYQVHL